MIALSGSPALVGAMMEDLFDVIECGSEEAWLAERDNGIGASEVAILLGLSDWASPFSLWAQKTGKMPRSESDAEWLEWGRFMEQPTAERYAYRTRRELRDLGRWTILRSRKWPWLFSTLDRVIVSVPEDDGGFYPRQPFMTGPGALEIKAPTIHGYHNWDEGAPLPYQAQLQTQLAVTGWRWGSFGANMPTGGFVAIDAERNERFVELLVEKTRVFWGCVERDDWPPVDGSAWTTQALKAMFPLDNGLTITLPPEATTWAAELDAAKQAKKHAEALADEMSNKLKAAIGEASFGELPDGTKYSLKTQTTKEHVRRASTTRVLRKVGEK